MKKHIYLMISCVLMLCVIVGCGKPEANSQEETRAVEEMTNTEEDITEEVTVDVSNEQEEVSTDTELEGEEVTETFEDIAIMDNAQNNGGHFVSMYDDMIYYITPDDMAMYESRLFAEFIDTYCGPTFLMAYNCQTDGVEVITDGHFFGKLFVAENNLFVNTYDEDAKDDRYKVAVVDPKERTWDYVKGDTVLGGDSKGNFVVTRGDYEQNKTSLYVYKDRSNEKQISIERYIDFIGVEDGYLVVACYVDEELEKKEIRCYDINDSFKEYKLGLVPDRELESYEKWPEYEQFYVEDGKMYLSVCWYEGTGHFFAEQAVVSAELTKENSIVKLELPESVYAEEYGPKFWSVFEGDLEVVPGITGTAYCTYEDGEYGYYDAEGFPVTRGTGFGVQYDEDGEVSFLNECTEYVNGRICMVNNYLVRNPGEDIGWRYAYIRKYTSIFIEEMFGGDGRNVENIVNQDYLDE